MHALNVFKGSVKLGFEIAVVVFAEHSLVGRKAYAFKHFASNRTFKR